MGHGFGSINGRTFDGRIDGFVIFTDTSSIVAMASLNDVNAVIDAGDGLFDGDVVIIAVFRTIGEPRGATTSVGALTKGFNKAFSNPGGVVYSLSKRFLEALIGEPYVIDGVPENGQFKEEFHHFIPGTGVFVKGLQGFRVDEDEVLVQFMMLVAGHGGIGVAFTAGDNGDFITDDVFGKIVD